MTIDGKDAERIARDLIHEIASEWIDTLTARCLSENDSYVFEFILHPGRVVRRAHVVDRPMAPSILRFDPLAEATEIVISFAFILEPESTDKKTRNAISPCIHAVEPQ